MAAAVGALDEAIKEYLLYRGFTQALKHFELERKEDKDKGFKVNRIIDHILQCINRSDFQSLQSFWIYLNKRFFSRLAHDSLMTVYRLETNILRFFLVQASRQGRTDVVRDFFERMANHLSDRKEWKDWFALPFTRNAEQHPSFKMYYSKDWSDAFILTLHNFFSTLYTCLPLPALLNFEAEHQKMQSLATENHHLHNQLAAAKQALAEAESNLQKMEARLAQQVASQAAGSHSSKRSYTTSKMSKPLQKPGQSGFRKKTSSFGSSSSSSTPQPAKKASVSKAASQEDTTTLPEQSEKQENPEPLASPKKEVNKGVAVEKLPKLPLSSEQETAETDLTSPGVIDEGSIRSFPDEDGNSPFLPVSQEVYTGHSAPITHCKFSPNATQVATADMDGRLRIWDPSNLGTTATEELKSSLLSMDWVTQSDHLVLIGSGDGMVRLYDSTSSVYHWEVSSDSKFQRILSVACSPVSSAAPTFAFAAAASAMTTSPLHTPHSTLTSPLLPSQKFQPSELRTMYRGSGDWPADAPPPGGLFVYDLKTQKQKCSLRLSPLPVALHCMAFNHNSNLLITGGADGMIRLFDVFQQECLCGWKAHDREVFNVQFSSDETSVYSMGRDNKFCQWSLNRSGEKVTDFLIHDNACQLPPGSVRGQFAPRGNLFAFESEDKYVLTCAPQQYGALVYKVGVEGALSRTLSVTGHAGPVTCVDWLQGRRSFSTCITGSTDTSIKVTNLLKN